MQITREVTVLAGALTLLLTGVNTLAQPEKPVPACSQKTFDGAVTAPFDTTGLVAITGALIEQGFSDDEIRLIMGGNTLRVLQEGLPKS